MSFPISAGVCLTAKHLTTAKQFIKGAKVHLWVILLDIVVSSLALACMLAYVPDRAPPFLSFVVPFPLILYFSFDYTLLIFIRVSL